MPDQYVPLSSLAQPVASHPATVTPTLDGLVGQSLRARVLGAGETSTPVDPALLEFWQSNAPVASHGPYVGMRAPTLKERWYDTANPWVDPAAPPIADANTIVDLLPPLLRPDPDFPVGPGDVNAVGAAFTAYHGSPHVFDKFSLKNIGTGEGAQTFGHGLYLAENPAVAQTYKKAGTGFEDLLRVDGKPLSVAMDSMDPAEEKLLEYVESVSGGMARNSNERIQSGSPADRIRAVREYMQGVVDTNRRAGMGTPRYEQALALMDRMGDRLSIAQPAKGNMYEVSVNAEPWEFIDWDSKIPDQPREVLQRIFGEDYVRDIDRFNKINYRLNEIKSHEGVWSRKPDTMQRVTAERDALVAERNALSTSIAKRSPTNGPWYDNTGQDIYAHFVMEQKRGKPNVPWEDDVNEFMGGADAAAASRELRARGIPGIRYFDQFSRDKSSGTHNLVIFDDSIIDILRRYGLLLPVAGGAALSQFSLPQDR